MLFARKTAASPAKLLRLVNTQEWRQGESLRITPKPKIRTNPVARRLVIRREGLGQLALSPMRWGLRVNTDSLTTIARPLTTIRSEVLRTQGEWRRLLNSQRCIIPAEQFFEWKRVGDIKTREFSIRLRTGKPMMIAGLWSRSDNYGESFAYISCQANPLVSLIHDQMPVILDQSAIQAWFNPDTSLEQLLSFLKPLRVDEIELTAVSKAQNTQRSNQPSLFDRQAA